MDSFLWSESYVTGLVEVDGQHKRLVEIINKFGQAIAQAENISDPEVDAAFQQLLAYAAEHFAQEEALMLRVGATLFDKIAGFDQIWRKSTKIFDLLACLSHSRHRQVYGQAACLY